MAAPTLAELMSADRPAWLWDGERGRIVWANAEGVRFFGGETLFDLIDQPFDAAEEGIARIRSLVKTLPRGEAAAETIKLPGASGDAAVQCSCTIHSLADGRPGLLVVAERTSAGEPLPPGLLSDMLMALPFGLVLAAPDGTIRFANAAARGLIDDDRLVSLAAMLGDPGEAEKLMARAGGSRLISAIVPLVTRYGSRDVRLTARPLSPEPLDGGPALLVLLDDVTDRRALERALAGGPEPAAGGRRLSDADRRTFEALAAAIVKAGGESAAERPPAPVPVASAPAEPLSAAPPAAPEVPELVSRPLDALPQAVVLHRGPELLFANRAAVSALGFPERTALMARPEIGKALGAAAPGEVSLVTASGTERRFTMARSSFPWNTGPVDQSTLVPIEAAGEPPGPTAERLPPARQEPPPAETPAAEVAGLAWEPDDAELRAILDTATDGIITLDEGGHIRGFSAGAEALFGYRLAEVAGRPFTDLLTPESRKVVRNYIAALGDSGLASVFNDGREVEAVVAQGATVPLFIAIGRIGASGGGAPGGAARAYCVVVRDLTQWKKTEAELRRAKESAERASAQKSEFLANISHELRTPLNAILGFSDVMRTQRFGELANSKYLGYAHDIHESGAHLLSLINDLLDLSKVEAGKLELNFTSVNLGSLVESCFAVLQEQAATARVVLRKSIPPGLPNVVADQRSMKQILLNLISNAIKFTDPGGQVVVSARTARSGELTLAVKDTGIGMSDAELRAAVEPFKRLEVPARDAAPGTGLGLPLTKALAEANRASFAISSEPQRGTLVEITFPTTRVLAG